jgi:hypothetical protein
MNGSLRAMERAVAENRLVQEQIGSTGGAIAYNAIKMATDLGRLAGLTPEDQEAFIRDNFGIVTTQEFIGSEDRTFLQKAAMSSASTGVAIAASAVGGAPLALATLWAAGTFEMFDDEEMKDVPKRDRFLMSAAYGVVSSYLEKIGLDELVGGSIGKKLAMNVVKDSAKKLTKDAPKEYIENLLISETKTRLQQAGVKVGVGMLAEGTTEALQSLASVSTKEVYDQWKGTDYFNNKSGWEIASDVLYDGALGAVGGGMISSAISGSQQVVQGRRASKMDTEIQALIAAAETEGMSDAVKTTLKAKIIRGEITKADAINILGDFNIIKSKVDQMPNTLTEEGKAASLDLMLEKDKLEKQIEGKDPNLVEPQKKRVNEINDRLKQIGKDAVQKQATGEVPVQSETGVSEEVEGGVPQPTTEQATEEVIGEEVVGEEVKGEQAQAEITQQEEVVPTEEDNSFVYKMNTEKTSTGKGKWEDDFEIIDNRDGGNLGKESAKWAVTNRITGETVEANSKKDAADIIKNAPAYGVDMWGDGMTVDFTDLGGKEQNKYREEFDRQKSERAPETETTETVSSKTQETAPSTESELDFEVTPEVNQEADALEKLLADEGITVESPVVDQPVAEETVVDTSEVSDRDIMEIEDNNENIRTEEDNIKQYQAEAKAKVDKINNYKWSLLRKKNEIAKVRQEYKDKIEDARLSIANNRSDVTKAETRVRKATKTTTTPVTDTAPVAETPVAAPARKPKAPKKLTKKETLQKYNDHIDSLIRDEKQTSDRRIVQLENQKNSATRERRTELTQQIQELELNFSSKKRELEGKKGNVEAAVEFVANAPRFRMSEGTQEEADTRNDEQAIVDKMNEASAEEKGLTRGEVPADVEVNPIEESSSLSKGLDKVLKFLGLKDKNSLLKRIEDFNGIPMILGMSDMLAAGTIKDSIGGDMVVDGGLLYNTLGKNVGLAWAGVTEDGANNQVKQARELYEANKELFDRLWAEGKIPNGHVPMAIMRMGNTAVNSNEAVFRYLLPLVKSLPLKNRTAALKTYMQTLQSKAEGNAASYWFTELEEQIGMGNLSTKEQVLDYLNNLAAEEQKAHEESKKEGESAKVKKIKSFINAIKKKKDGQERTFEDIREDLNDRLEKIVPFMLASYIKSNKIKTLDGFLEAVVNESKKRADGDKNIFSLPVRSFIFNSLISPETTKGKNSLEVIKTLLDGVKNADATIFTAKHIYDAIGEKSMLKANKGDVVGVMGIKVVDEDGNSAGGAKKAEHNNYGYGPEGKVIALIKNPKQGIDVFPEFRAKLARVFKPSKTGKYPSIEDAVGQTGGAFFMDAAFRGTAPAVDAMTDLKILIGKLRFAFPEVSVATTQEEFDAFMEKEGVRAREKDGKVIYGVTKDGRIFLNPSEQTLRTPIHEFGHIWIDYLRSTASGKKGDMLLQKGFELVDGTPEYERALKEYGSRELALEEALVELMAVKGDTIISAAKKSQFLEWMNGLFKYIKENLTRSKDFAQTRIKDLTLDEFINIGLADLFSGQKVSGKFDPRTAGGASRARFSKIDSIAKIIDAARKNNVSDQAIKLVLARKGFAVADINDAFNSATQAEEDLDATLPGYTELLANVDTMIARQISRNIEPAKISKNVDALVRKSDVYKNATDLQKKAIEANTKAKTGTRQTVAPSSGRIIGAVGDIQNLTAKEKLAIAKRIIKLAKDASANLSSEIKDLAKSGKITTNQMTTIFNRLKDVNLLDERSVNSFIDYMANVFNKADYASKVSRAISLKKKVINNARTKLGIASSLISEIVTMASIKPSVIPASVLDQYMELMEMLGARQTVLTLNEKSEMSQGVSNVLNAVNEEMSEAQSLAEQFDNYEEKELNENGGVDFAKTLKKMIADGTITDAQAEIMRKYKSEIVDSESTKKTPEELEEEKKGLLEDLKNKKISPEAIASLGTRLERDDAESLAALLETDAVNELNNTTLKNVLKLVDNINNGFLPHYAKVIEKKLDGINKSMEMQESLSEGKTAVVSGFFSSIRAGVKTLMGKQDSTKEKELIRSTALGKIDEVFGNFKNNAIFKALFQQSAIGIDAYNTELNVLLDKLDDARDKVLRSFGVKLRKDPNTFVNSSFKMMTYLLQLEKNSNPDSNQVNNAVDFIKKTQQQIKNDRSTYTKRDSDLLQGILNDFVDADTKQIDINKLYSSFNQAEKNAIKAIQEVNESMTEKAIYTSAIIRGDKINPILNYISHSVIVDTNLNSDVRGASDVDSFTSSRQVSTRARSLEERTGTVTAISFDPFATTQKSTKGVLLDFHMTIPYQTAMITLNETRKRMEESKGGMSEKQRLYLNAIESAYTEASKNALQSSLLRSSVGDMVVKMMSDAGYRAILGTSVTRTLSELGSNVSGAAFMNSAAMIKGIKEHSAYLNPDRGASIMKILKSTQIGRTFGGGGLFTDPSIGRQNVGTDRLRAKSNLQSTTEMIYNRSLKPIKNKFEGFADVLTSSPDKLVTRPMWFGSFSNEFKKASGKEVDFDKIEANDEAYMKENADAIQKATEKADRNVLQLSATNNAYVGVLKNNISPDLSGFAKTIKVFDNFLTRFTTYEYLNARTAIYNLLNDGMLTKREAAGLLLGVTTRMISYTMLSKTLGTGLVSLVSMLRGDDDDEEDDDKTFMQKLGQAGASAGTTLFLGRNFGNIARNVIGYGVEEMNEKYLTNLRNGDYDPYKDAIQYTVAPVEKKADQGKGVDVADYAFNMMGPMSPFAKTLRYSVSKLTEKDRVAPKESDSDAVKKKRREAVTRQNRERNYRVPLELAGTSGFVPLYKDFRNIVNNWIYDDLKKSLKEQEANKEKKAEMLMGYESKTDMKDSNPKLYDRLYDKGGKYYAEEEVRLAKENLKNSLKKIEKNLRSGEINYSKARILKRKALRTSEKRIRKAT